jgi:hypothetical protein
MNKMNFSVIMVILLIIVMGGLLEYSILNGVNYQNKENLSINSFETNFTQVLGSTDYGMVIKSGPYGNPNGTQKIAFIVGVHPLEADSHRAVASSLLSLNKSLNSTYYIYIVDVTKDRTSYTNGRMNGQLLARKFVVPDIIQNHFNLAVDVHSNRGDNFQKENFVYVPKNETKSMDIANNLTAEIPWIVYYVPPSETGPKSPSYVTIPLINSGIPAIIYESYRYEPYYVTVDHAVDFIRVVDKLKLT